MSKRQREQGEVIAEQLRLGWRERLKREQIAQREAKKAEAEAATRMAHAPAAHAPEPASMARVARAIGLDRIKALGANAAELAYECKDCRDIGLVLVDRQSEATGDYLASYPCKACRRGRAKQRVWDKWHKKKGATPKGAPSVPSWLDEPWD